MEIVVVWFMNSPGVNGSIVGMNQCRSQSISLTTNGGTLSSDR